MTLSSGASRRSIFPLVALTALVLVFSVSCSKAKRKSIAQERAGVKTTQVETAPEFCCVKTLVVLNFLEIGQDGEAERTVTCPVTDLNFPSGRVEEGAGELIADQFRYLMSERGFRVAGRDETLEAIIRTAREEGESHAGFALRVARALNMDAALTGSVARFEERIGGKIAADRPASVAFSVAIINAADGKIVWKAKFDKTQKALFEDVLDYKTFFKGGMVWQKAAKLSEIGVKNVLDRIPFHGDRP